MRPSVDATRVIQADAKSCRRPGALQGLDSQRETENESAEGPQISNIYQDHVSRQTCLLPLLPGSLESSIFCDDYVTYFTPSVFISRGSYTLGAQVWLQLFNYPTSAFLAPMAPYRVYCLAFRMR